MAVTSPLRRRQTVAALLTLTAVTGLVDAVSYLGLGHVFVANMTGNVVFLGLFAGPHRGLSAAASLIAIGGFLLGALAGGRAAARLAVRPRCWLVSAFAAETVILALVAAGTASGLLPLAGDGRYATIAVLASALGVQNSTVRHLGAPDLTTTVLTLTLTGLAADSAPGGGSGARPHRRLGSVAAMLAGAAAGAALLQVSASAVLALAALLLAAVTGVFAWGSAAPAAAPRRRQATGAARPAVPAVPAATAAPAAAAAREPAPARRTLRAGRPHRALRTGA